MALKSRYTRQNLFPLQEEGMAFRLVVRYFNVVCRHIFLPPPPPAPSPPLSRALAPSILGAAESREAESVKGPGERERERELL